MKGRKILGNVIFWATLISPMISFMLASEIGEVDIFGVAGIIRYSWIMLLFIPIGIISVLMGFKLKKSGEKYKKNFIIAFICLPIILIFGSYRFIFSSNISYNADRITVIEKKINLILPENIKIATETGKTYNVSYVKIVDNESKEKFEQEIEINDLWKNELGTKIEKLLPNSIQYEIYNFDYFVFYNITSNKYNEYPDDGEWNCVFIAYDNELQRLIILDEYKVVLN